MIAAWNESLNAGPVYTLPELVSIVFAVASRLSFRAAIVLSSVAKINNADVLPEQAVN